MQEGSSLSHILKLDLFLHIYQEKKLRSNMRYFINVILGNVA